MWKILRQANRKCLAPKDNPQKLTIKLISSGVLTLITLHWSIIEKYTCISIILKKGRPNLPC